jgi:hypothetical protein
MTENPFAFAKRLWRGYATAVVLSVLTILGALETVWADESIAPADGAAIEKPAAVTLENRHLRLLIGRDGRSLQFVDKRTGKDFCTHRANRPFASVTIGTREHPASAVRHEGSQIALRFEGTDAEALMQATARDDYLVFEVVSVSGPRVDVLTLLDVTLADQASSDDDFAACALALNLKTNVPEIPQPTTHLRAMCYARFGFAGARVAVIGCPLSAMRGIMKQVVRDTPELPQSDVGGPCSLDAPINRGSYLFNFGDLSEETAADWIALAHQLGIDQIDFHGGQSFRFGDCRPNPKTYPEGLASLKAVVDRLHAAGVAAGLHTYAFFLDKRSRWVTPVPDSRLAKDASFTLAQPLSANATVVPVVESTDKMSTTTGFFVRNSVTLQIDDELITYGGVASSDGPAFTACQRGVLGTQVATHAAGAKVHHLKECFGLFVPDPETTLFAEVAARQAEVCNTCGFDMMYFDALDGEDILGGPKNGWHYGSKFVFEVFARLEKPVAMEMSTFHHHLWYVRGRMGAWDHPRRSHKKFIDIHCAANESVERMFLPAHLGWWRVMTASGIHGEPTYADDIEYLCGKCLGHDIGFSVMGVNPSNVKTVPAYRRLGRIMQQYESLRHDDYFGEAIKAQLRQPGKEFTLYQQDDGRWRFRRVQYAKHKVSRVDGRSNHWSVRNSFDEQPVRLRIEALSAAGPYDAPANPCLADFSDTQRFRDQATAPGVTVALESVTDPVRAGQRSGALTASSTGQTPRRSAWAKAVKRFTPTIDMSKHPALGVWVHGDGSGALLNFQLTSPPHVVAGIGEHYVQLDFTGWRYFELIEPEGERYADYQWPYGSAYSIYREHVAAKQVATLGLYLNDLPGEGKTVCYLSPVKALPLVPIRLKDPAITIGGKTIRFPVSIETGSYLEFYSRADCKLYDGNGAMIAEVTPQGDVPELTQGDNQVEFQCAGPTDVSARAQVTLSTLGDPL